MLTNRWTRLPTGDQSMDTSAQRRGQGQCKTRSRWLWEMHTGVYTSHIQCEKQSYDLMRVWTLPFRSQAGRYWTSLTSGNPIILQNEWHTITGHSRPRRRNTKLTNQPNTVVYVNWNAETYPQYMSIRGHTSKNKHTREVPSFNFLTRWEDGCLECLGGRATLAVFVPSVMQMSYRKFYASWSLGFTGSFFFFFFSLVCLPRPK